MSSHSSMLCPDMCLSAALLCGYIQRTKLLHVDTNRQTDGQKDSSPSLAPADGVPHEVLPVVQEIHSEHEIFVPCLRVGDTR